LLAPRGQQAHRPRPFTYPRGVVLAAHRRASACRVVVSCSPRRVRARKGGREGAAVRLHPLRQIRSDAPSNPSHGHYPDARLNGFDIADPPRLRLEEPFPEYEPTSDVLCHRHGTFSSAPPRRSLATADRLATTRVLHRSNQKRAPPARLRATSHHSRTPSAVSRTMSCDSVETRMRIRPRESSLSRPFAPASFVPPHRRGGCELLRG
jgi:hypothetical protein